MNALLTQFVHLLGAVLLMLAFAMIAQRRVLSLIKLYTLQGAVLVLSTLVVAYVTQQSHLYLSAAITFALKVLLIPWLLHRVVLRLHIESDIETLINIPTTSLLPPVPYSAEQAHLPFFCAEKYRLQKQAHIFYH